MPLLIPRPFGGSPYPGHEAPKSHQAGANSSGAARQGAATGSSSPAHCQQQQVSKRLRSPWSSVFGAVLSAVNSVTATSSSSGDSRDSGVTGDLDPLGESAPPDPHSRQPEAPGAVGPSAAEATEMLNAVGGAKKGQQQQQQQQRRGGGSSWPSAAVAPTPPRFEEPSAPPLPSDLYALNGDMLNGDYQRHQQQQQQQQRYGYHHDPRDPRAAVQGQVWPTDPRVGARALPATAGANSNLLTVAAGAPAEAVSGLLGRFGALVSGLRGGGGGGGGLTDATTHAGAAADGRQVMQRMRDILFADASLFKVEEGSGRVLSLLDGDSLRLRLRPRQHLPTQQQQREREREKQRRRAGGDMPYDDEGVVQMQIGDVATLDLNPPDAEPLHFLRAAPGVYTFRCPPERSLELNLRTSASGGGGAAWPVPGRVAADSGRPLHRTGKHAGKGSSSDGVGAENDSDGIGSGGSGGSDSSGGGGEGGRYYYCLTVSPAVCDSATLEQLDAVLAAYTRLSRMPDGRYSAAVTAAATGATAAAAQQWGPTAGAAGMYDSSGGGIVNAAPAGPVDYTPPTGPVPYPAVPMGDVGFYKGPTPVVPEAAQPGPSGFGNIRYSLAVVPAVASSATAAAMAAVASAASAPDGTARLAERVVGAARAVGGAVVSAAHSLAYDIRRRADDLVRRAPSPPGISGFGGGVTAGARTVTLLPLRIAVVAAWLLARAAATAVGVMTEVLAAIGAAAAELILFSGALLARWMPALGGPSASSRSTASTALYGGADRGAYGSSTGPGLLVGSLSTLAAPSHLVRTMTATALLVYGELHGSLEEAARVLLRALADAASELAAHAGGPQAAGLTRGSLEAVGYALDAVTGVRKVGLRAVAREFQRRQAAAMLGTLPPPPPPSSRLRRRR